MTTRRKPSKASATSGLTTAPEIGHPGYEPAPTPASVPPLRPNREERSLRNSNGARGGVDARCQSKVARGCLYFRVIDVTAARPSQPAVQRARFARRFCDVRSVFTTRRRAGVLIANALAAFGLISAAIQFVGQVFSIRFAYPAALTGSAVLACLVWGVARATPQHDVARDFGHPDIRVRVRVGDLFDESDHMVVGFSDTFDTDTSGDVVISRWSLQGQLLDRLYRGDRDQLDRELTAALAPITPASVESDAEKPLGKRERYPIGTVATLQQADRMIFCCAYSRLGNDLVARSSMDDMWVSLGRLWEAIAARGGRQPVAMPLVGSELARIDAMSRENLLRMILLSFVCSSNMKVVTRELTLVIHPKDLAKVDMVELEAFLRSL